MEKETTTTPGNVASAMFLVAGTCIGGGMLAMPLGTGICGFLPSMVLMFVCWFCMTVTALLLLEISLWMKEGAHMISMASRLLGPIGKGVSWCLYLFICYASNVGYTAAGGIQISAFFNENLDIALTKDLGCVIFILVYTTVIYLGSIVVGRINTILFGAMILAYIALVSTGVSEIKPGFLLHQDWSYSLVAIPLLLTAFSCQTMIPSLTPYLKKNARSLRIAIIGGTTIACLVYALWQIVILGIVPLEGSNGLADALIKGEPPTQFLREHVNVQWVSTIAEYFAFFAISTSYLGITYGLFDFLSDGLSIKEEGYGKLILGALIVIPTMIFSTQFERVFMIAMETTGGFGDSILCGMMPIMMVWIGRYRLGHIQNICVPGGRPILVVVFCFFLFTLIIAFFNLFGYVSPIERAIEYQRELFNLDME